MAIKTSNQITFTDYKKIGAADFQIYSVDGFEFNDNLTSITLKTVALQNDKIVYGEKYQWSWWNKDAESGPAYEDIPSATTSSITISATSPYIFSDIKCTMTYNGNLYEDHVSLRKEVEIYNASIRFFGGNNVICEKSDFVVAYVNLYKNNALIETIPTDNYYIDDGVSINGTQINTSVVGLDEDLMYFIYKAGSDYAITLGKYTNGAWRVQDQQCIYTYDNNFNTHKSNVVLVTRNQISNSSEIVFNIHDANNNNITMSAATIIDLNDPVVSNVEPNNPIVGQLWVDTTTEHNTLKVWDGKQWVSSGYQGGVIYTSQPSSYSSGDLWVLDADWNGFAAGTMLKATETSSVFNKNHWAYTNAELAEMQANLRQYFSFDANSGLRIGQSGSGNKFYVNIDSQKMGFHSVDEHNNDIEVVHVGVNSATIKNAILEGDDETQIKNNATFDKEVKFGKFLWKVENNGSLSLSISG